MKSSRTKKAAYPRAGRRVGSPAQPSGWDPVYLIRRHTPSFLAVEIGYRLARAPGLPVIGARVFQTAGTSNCSPMRRFPTRCATPKRPPACSYSPDSNPNISPVERRLCCSVGKDEDFWRIHVLSRNTVCARRRSTGAIFGLMANPLAPSPVQVRDAIPVAAATGVRPRTQRRPPRRS